MRALVASSCAAAGLFAASAGAQLRGVKAELTPLVESEAAPGAAVRAALQVRIPDRFHVQSNAPRDPTLIPTVLTVDAPEGVKVTEIVFPQATDFKQSGQAQPLRVFEHEFAIGVSLEIVIDMSRAIDRGAWRTSAIRPATTRLCYAPVTADVLWTLTRRERRRRASDEPHPRSSRSIAFGTGRGTAAAAPIASTVRPVNVGAATAVAIESVHGREQHWWLHRH